MRIDQIQQKYRQMFTRSFVTQTDTGLRSDVWGLGVGVGERGCPWNPTKSNRTVGFGVVNGEGRKQITPEETPGL